MKTWLLEKLIDWLAPMKTEPLTDLATLEILEKANTVPDFGKLLEVMADNDLRIYFKYPEKNNEARMIRKGMILRTKMLLQAMTTAKEKLDKLNNPNNNT